MSGALPQLTGMMAGILTTLAFLPQVIKVWKKRSAADLSLGMYLTFITGVALWLGYGLMTGDMPVTLANAVTLVLSGAVLVMKLIFDRRTPA